MNIKRGMAKIKHIALKKYEEKIKELINLDKPSRELLQSIIDKIIIDKDRNIEIFYKFSLLNNI